MKLRDNGRARARELGIVIGTLPTGPNNAITDVAGRQGRPDDPDLRREDTDRRRGTGPHRRHRHHPARTTSASIRSTPATTQLNGNGEMTGIAWIEEAGLLHPPIAITNTHSVGVVRDAIIARSVAGESTTGGCTGRCRSLARPTTAGSTTSTASTSSRARLRRRSTPQQPDRSRKAASAAAPA